MIDKGEKRVNQRIVLSTSGARSSRHLQVKRWTLFSVSLYIKINTKCMMWERCPEKGTPPTPSISHSGDIQISCSINPASEPMWIPWRPQGRCRIFLSLDKQLPQKHDFQTRSSTTHSLPRRQGYITQAPGRGTGTQSHLLSNVQPKYSDHTWIKNVENFASHLLEKELQVSSALLIMTSECQSSENNL